MGSRVSTFALRINLVRCAFVQNLETAHKVTETCPLSESKFSARLILALLFFAALWFVLCRQLSGEWSVNEQYNFGWFVPFFALYLFWLRWQDRPEPPVNGQSSVVSAQRLVAVAIGLIALLLLLPVRLFEIANPEWRPLAWLHTAAVVTLTLLYIWYAGGGPWLRHFAFPIAFIFIAVPWVTAVEAPVIQGLMRAVARVAAETAMLLGIPAHLEGNLIRVTSGLIGVNEACSGIRSLQTSLMIGLLFGELKRLSILRRVALVTGAVAIGLFANFLRAVFLVRVAAAKNILEVTRWHDIAGYTIIALVFVGTLGLAYLLGRSKTKSHTPEVTSQKSQGSGLWSVVIRQPPASYLAAALCWLLIVEIGTAAWYRVHENNLVSGIGLNVKWPEQAPNFHELKIDKEIRTVLRFDEGHAATWTITLPAEVGSAHRADRTISCFLYFFRWKPGRNSALLANLHRPDVCLPAIGWSQVADTGVRNYSVSGPFELPFRHFEFHRAFENSAPQTAHAFYCLLEDRAPGPSSAGANPAQMSGSRSSWTRAERLRAVLEGRRHLGQQVIEFVTLTREPIDVDEIDAHFAQALPGLVKIDR
jgi:exosortase